MEWGQDQFRNQDQELDYNQNLGQDQAQGPGEKDHQHNQDLKTIIANSSSTELVTR